MYTSIDIHEISWDSNTSAFVSNLCPASEAKERRAERLREWPGKCDLYSEWQGFVRYQVNIELLKYVEINKQ